MDERKITDGWFRGLAEGFEFSGGILGALVPLIMVGVFLTILIGGGLYVRSFLRTEERPKPCVDYSYKMDIIGDSEARCTRWPAMKMRLEKRWVKADIVHCTCTPESFPAEEPRND